MKKQLLLVAGLALLTSACANLCETDCGVKACKSGDVLATVNTSLFAFDSAKLTSGDQSALKDAAATLNADVNADKTVTAKGYASTEGAASYNVDLSRRRAEAVKAYLVGEGVADSRIAVKGEGATTEFGEPKENRRVMVVVD